MAILLVAAGLLFGCALPEPNLPETGELHELAPRQILEEQKVLAPPGPPPFVEQLAPVFEEADAPLRLYSMSLEAAPFGAALQSVVQGTDLSLSIEAAVDLARPVTVHLRNSPLAETLDMVVVKGAGYAWKLEDGQLEITRFAERIYALDYLNVLGAVNVKVGGDMLASSVESAQVSGRFEIQADRKRDEVNIWEQIEGVLEGLKSEDGILRVNHSSGLIYMADTPKRLATMEQFLDTLKASLNRQVFIEAKIMEVQLDESKRYGIDWGDIELFINPSKVGGDPDFANLNFNRSGLITLSETTGVQAVVDFLESQGDVRVLSNPHLSVMNGQSAVMTVGSQFPFSDIESVDRDEETNVVSIDATIKRVVFGVQFGITPQISGDGHVTLHVVPTLTRNEGTEEIEVPIGFIGTETIANPVIGLQEMATTVRVKEGQTVVLGGLISQEQTVDTSGLPGLRRIPLIGRLFGNFEQQTKSKELVILIKPFIKEMS